MNSKKQFVIDLAKEKFSMGRKMSIQDLAAALNAHKFTTDHGKQFLGGRGMHFLIRQTVISLQELGGRESDILAIQKTFTPPAFLNKKSK